MFVRMYVRMLSICPSISTHLVNEHQWQQSTQQLGHNRKAGEKGEREAYG